MKITFVLTVHLPDDERIWYQQADALRNCGHEVSIISSKIENSKLSNVICFNDLGLPKKEVVHRITNLLFEIKPEIMICDNPISVRSAKLYKKNTNIKTTIIYDVTEWYPSKINLQNVVFFKKIIKFFSLIFLSFYAGCVVDKFIFGEYHKGKLFRILFPWKRFIYLPYFANIELIKRYPVQDLSKRCELFYSGNLTKSNGFDKILKVTEKCAEKHPKMHFTLKVIATEQFDIIAFKNVHNLEIQFVDKMSFPDFCNEIGKSDIFLDLRRIDFIKNHSLPIKIFYYLAAGRPVIYSELKAIKKFFPKNELNSFGQLVDPENIESIVEVIENYVNNQDYYNKCCNFSYELAKNKYNWNIIEDIFIDFIENND